MESNGSFDTSSAVLPKAPTVVSSQYGFFGTMDAATVDMAGYILLGVIVLSLIIFIRGEVKRRSSPVPTTNKNTWALIPIFYIAGIFLLLFAFVAYMFRDG